MGDEKKIEERSFVFRTFRELEDLARQGDTESRFRRQEVHDTVSTF
ncbi:hypothetical protein [Streptococcus ovuberis]|uniref:Uncharacterized protein n=1 Tax=Streptococcus ovuberis TaxID=1936207 RepID=A0A7X6MWE0_9STRE|nr:hypothetical protein [Streptococcus ovuberis]NKZ19605.1 hypothetical protein [Streptococcus ovuberis]